MAASEATAALVERVLARDARAVARAMTLVEDGRPEAADLIRQIFPRTGRAYVVGVTGAPGAGKSTIVDRLVSEIRREEKTVGVIAVDPTSPFTGGAVLGDRVRMQTHAGDAGVFIRSMATRGALGGLARATDDATLILDAAGMDIILIETVGVGQAEVDIVRVADVSILTVVPGAGDEVQSLKAGIMEIADVFAVNKADREGAASAVAQIQAILSLVAYPSGAWRPPVIETVATTGRGIAALWAAVEAYRQASADGRGTRRRARAEMRLRELTGQRLLDRLLGTVLAPGEFDAIVERVARRDMDPYSAAEDMLGRALKHE